MRHPHLFAKYIAHEQQITVGSGSQAVNAVTGDPRYKLAGSGGDVCAVDGRVHACLVRGRTEHGLQVGDNEVTGAVMR